MPVGGGVNVSPWNDSKGVGVALGPDVVPAVGVAVTTLVGDGGGVVATVGVGVATFTTTGPQIAGTCA